jgi:hypothetical protein
MARVYDMKVPIKPALRRIAQSGAPSTGSALVMDWTSETNQEGSAPALCIVFPNWAGPSLSEF